MMTIVNRRFWELWESGKYDEALSCPVEEQQEQGNVLQNMLFGTPEQLKQMGMIASVSAGEFLYDYIMVNPAVVRGIDFARAEDLSSLFTLSQFARSVDRTVITGDIAQLQGYVAEQMIATELQAKGYDVEFPETSNNAGWDILVDGKEFQVKSLADPAGVKDHLTKYPHIPVYVNEELAPHFEGNENVYVSNISREEVLVATNKTLAHGEDILDFEIPWIAAGVSSIHNIKKVWRDDLSIQEAVLSVVSDTSSRVVLGILGQKTCVIAGTILFGPAGGITGAMFGTYVGSSQGAKLSSSVKRLFSKRKEEELNRAVICLLEKVITQIEQKTKIKSKKMNNIKNQFVHSSANLSIQQEVDRHQRKQTTYLLHKKEALIVMSKSVHARKLFVPDILVDMMIIITKSGVHPVHFQTELKHVQQTAKAYMSLLS